MPNLKKIIEAGGGEWVGIQGAKMGNLILFNDPTNRGTLAVREEELTVAAVRAAIEKSRQAFAKTPEVKP